MDDAVPLQAAGIEVRFGGVRALADVDLDVQARSITGLIGPNGAGKTTLLDVLAGLRSPSQGTVSLAGRDVTSWSATKLARAGVRRTFQRQQAFGWLSIEENVVVALEWETRRLRQLVLGGRRWSPEARERVDRTLADCGLTEVASKPAGSMPIGVLRMMELARALVGEPKVLLLDEPTSGLQHEQTATYGEIVQAYVERTGAAVVLVEHDVEFVMSLCSNVMVLEAGSVLAGGSPAAVQADPRVISAYLGVADAPDLEEVPARG